MGRRILLSMLGLFAALSAWGLWHVWTHAVLDIQIHDYALSARYLAYGSPEGAKIELFDEKHAALAVARTADPYDFVTASHPTLGDCRKLQSAGAEKYGDCYAKYSRWISGWAGRARFATLSKGDCVIRDIPVRPVHSKSGWATWWFPLAHGAGKPFEYIQLVIDVNTVTCTRVK